jgi:hypothetical protein
VFPGGRLDIWRRAVRATWCEPKDLKPSHSERQLRNRDEAQGLQEAGWGILS